jgi:hypothetical protein
VIVPVRVPAAVGVNVTVTVQVLFCASDAVHVVVRLKSPVAAEIDIPLIAPLFAVSVTDCPALVLPVFWFAYVNEPEVRPSAGGNTPVPLKLIVCGLPAPDELTVIAPVRVPVAVGVKVTVIEQVLFCASVVLQVFVWLKSPVAAETTMLFTAPLLAVKTIDCDALLVFVTWFANVSEPWESPSAGGNTPVPLKLIVCGLPSPEEVIVIAPVRVPATVGVNVTVTVQVAFCARVAVQLFVWLKSPVAADTTTLLTLPLFAMIVTAWEALVVFVIWFVYVSVLDVSPSAGAKTPVPLKLIVCGLPAPDDVTVIAPVRVPAAVGVNVTVIVQVLFCASVVAQDVVRLKSPVAAEMAMPLTPPLFAVSVTVCDALVVFVFWLAYVSELDVNPSAGGRTPVPLKLMVCGLPVPEDVTVIAPVRVPAAVGVNVTVIVQVALCASVVRQLFVWLKSPVAAETAMLFTAPLFAVRVTVCDPLVVFVIWFVYVNVPVDKPSAGGNTPVPLKLIVCGLPAPEDVTVIAPVRAPATVGVNVTVTVQVAFCASVAAQLFVWLKSPVAAETAIVLIPPLFAVSVTVCDALVVFVTWFV